MPGRDSPDDYFTTGLTVSFIAHLLVAGVFFISVLPGLGDFAEPIVYSISIEGGRTLGGQSQVAKEEKSQLAPMKAVASQPKVAEKDPEKTPEKVEEKKPEPVKPDEDAEVSTHEAKPTPQPAKPTPKATEAPVVKPTTGPTAKPTAKPADKQPTPKVDSKAKLKTEGDEVDKQLQARLKQYLGESSDGGGKGFGAAKLGGNGMGGGVVRPPEFFTYRNMVQSRLREALRWYDPQSQLMAEVFFYLDKDGTIRDVEVRRSSGDSAFDEAAVRAVLKVNPLPPPPESVYPFFKDGFIPKIRANE